MTQTLSAQSGLDNKTMEVPFAFDELFFSRTDERGIILSGNSVFQRISLYTWEELLRKPHNVIRHPDMPKAVFWLLWDRIKKKEPIGAYVKNRAKDGRYYWVFAIVTPVEGGYLSVRLKPSSDVFQVVVKEYAALVAKERSDSIKPADSAALLLARLVELGFKDYETFMSTALRHEMLARDKMTQRPPDRSLASYEELVRDAEGMIKQTELIYEAYGRNQYVPINLRVQAVQLGQSGATIGVISNNYNIISSEIKNCLDEFMVSAANVLATIHNGSFLTSTARVQDEVVELFRKETTAAEISQANEMANLQIQREAYRGKAGKGLQEMALQVARFHQACTEMKRLAAGLEVTRIMGKVESSRLTVRKDGLNELIDDLELFQTSISDCLKEIERMNSNIQRNIEVLLLEMRASKPGVRKQKAAA